MSKLADEVLGVPEEYKGLVVSKPAALLPSLSAKSIRDCTELHMSSMGLYKLANFNRFVNLKILYLGSNRLTEISGLDSCFRMEKLSCPDNRIRSLEGSLQHFKFLRVLLLGNNAISGLSQAIQYLKNMRFLRELELSGNPVSQEVGYRLRVVASMPSLEVLDRQRITVLERYAASRKFSASPKGSPRSRASRGGTSALLASPAAARRSRGVAAGQGTRPAALGASRSGLPRDLGLGATTSRGLPLFAAGGESLTRRELARTVRRAQRKRQANARRATAENLSHGRKARDRVARDDSGLTSALRLACEGEAGLKASTLAVDMLGRGALPEDAAVAAGLYEARGAAGSGALFPGSRPRSVGGVRQARYQQSYTVRAARTRAKKAVELQQALARTGGGGTTGIVGGHTGGRMEGAQAGTTFGSPLRRHADSGAGAGTMRGDGPGFGASSGGYMYSTGALGGSLALGLTRPGAHGVPMGASWTGSWTGIGTGGGLAGTGEEKELPAALYTLDPALFDVGAKDGAVAGRVGAAASDTQEALGAAALTAQTGVLGQWERVQLQRVFDEADADRSGQLTGREIARAMDRAADLGLVPWALGAGLAVGSDPKDVVDEMLRSLDRDGSGSISRKEFLRAAAPPPREAARLQLRAREAARATARERRADGTVDPARLAQRRLRKTGRAGGVGTGGRGGGRQFGFRVMEPAEAMERARGHRARAVLLRQRAARIEPAAEGTVVASAHNKDRRSPEELRAAREQAARMRAEATELQLRASSLESLARDREGRFDPPELPPAPPKSRRDFVTFVSSVPLREAKKSLRRGGRDHRAPPPGEESDSDSDDEDGKVEPGTDTTFDEYRRLRRARKPHVVVSSQVEL